MTLAALACVVVAVWLAVFLGAYIHYLNKAKKRQQAFNEPIRHGKVLQEALAVACVVGCIVCLAGVKAEAAADKQADVEAQQVQPAGGDAMQVPMAQPQMDWTPLKSGAEDQIQG